MIKVRSSPETLHSFFDTVILELPYLTQIKLQGLSLNRLETTDKLMEVLNKHKRYLELLDLQDCKMSGL